MKKQGRARLLLGGLLALGWLSGSTVDTAYAQAPPHSSVEQTGFHRPWRPAPPCPPTVIAPPITNVEPVPYVPKKVTDPKTVDPKTVDPKTIDPKVDLTTPPTPDSFSQLSPSGGGSAQTIAPNMFGDRFGTSTGHSTLFTFRQRNLPNQRITLAGTPFGAGTGLPPDQGIVVNPTAPATPGLGPNALLIVNAKDPQVVPGAVLPLTINQPFVDANLQRPGAGQPGVQALNGVVTVAPPLFFGGPSTFAVGPFVADVSYLELSQIALNVPNPGAGGVVGRTKVTDETNPLPRDRFIFTYDYFDNVPLRAGGQNVNRYSFGVEKTFFDGMTSIEVRMPFASTLENDIQVGTQGTNTQLGNLFVTLKALLYRTDTLAIATGTGISLPTEEDTRVYAGSTELVRIENRTVVFEPYLAALWTPNERFFSQVWGTIPFDTRGNPVHINSDFAGLSRAGTIHDQTRLFLDAQVGYWLVRNGPESRLRGLAPFVELHYATTLNDADIVRSGLFAVGDFNNRSDQLNLTSGFVTQLGDNFNLSLGVVVPLRTAPDREFDYQVGVRAAYFFGPTARDRNNSYQAGGF